MQRSRVLTDSVRYLLLGFCCLAATSVFSAGFDLDGLARVASDRGWETARAADGSLLLYPEGAKAVFAEQPPADHLAPLQQRLAAAGWRTERDHDGNLLLYPGAQKTAVPTIAKPVQPTQPTDRLAGLEGRLKATGWNVSRDTDGSLLLHPKTGFEATTIARPTAKPSPAGCLVTLAERLEARGWHVRRDSDGSLLLHPHQLPHHSGNQLDS
ncbi:MAG: hypothetical protein ABFS23_06120 [Pseudomonadota bacterium]